MGSGGRGEEGSQLNHHTPGLWYFSKVILHDPPLGSNKLAAYTSPPDCRVTFYLQSKIFFKNRREMPNLYW